MNLFFKKKKHTYNTWTSFLIEKNSLDLQQIKVTDTNYYTRMFEKEKWFGWSSGALNLLSCS
jgi:hypothetical protein